MTDFEKLCTQADRLAFCAPTMTPDEILKQCQEMQRLLAQVRKRHIRRNDLRLVVSK